VFLTVCDVLVETRTLEVVSLEELREDAGMCVDHLDFGVAVVFIARYTRPDIYMRCNDIFLVRGERTKTSVL